MRITLKIVIVFALIVGGFYLYYNYISSDTSPATTQAQNEILELFGLPEQFMVSYLPRGEGEEMVLARFEAWYYPRHEKKFTFLAGELFSVEDFKPETKLVAPTNLRPQDFEFSMDYNEVSKIIGYANVKETDFLPGFFGEIEKIKTYLSSNATFVIQDGHLVYIQTVGIGEDASQ